MGKGKWEGREGKRGGRDRGGGRDEEEFASLALGGIDASDSSCSSGGPWFLI